MAKTLQEFSGDPNAAERYHEFIDWAQDLHRISENFFFWKPVGGIKDIFSASGLVDPKLLRDVLKMKMGTSVASSVRSYISDERAAQMIDHFTQYVGSSPDASPAILCGIAHMQTGEGVWYPEGGTRAVPLALEKLGAELGVEFRTNTKVETIVHDQSRVLGVQTADGEKHDFDNVVSNCDSVRTFQELIGSAPANSFAAKREYEPACSGVVLYLGLKERYDNLLHHNFVFSRDPHEEFQAIYDQGIPAPDPTAYVCAPAVTEPGVAPEGGEALYILVHTPYLREGQNWSEMLPGYRQVILDKLKSCAGLEDIEDRIVTESALTPQDINDRYHVLNGAIYGLASHGKFNGAFKPSNRRKELDGLYLCGGAAHPGPGMPMVLMSGWIAADALDVDAGAIAA
ncbi:MAG: phytoene desaturase family protein, partial [Verrucomicrobiota bacterium]